MVRRRWIDKGLGDPAILGILALAFAIQLYHLDARTFHGDELHSIAESSAIGLNPNGILYFGLMHFWQALGTTEMWLRVPAVFFSIGSVALCYRWATFLIDRRAGIAMGLLVATSPFVLEYAQQDRFYTLFLFAASAIYLAFALYLKRPSRARLVVLILFNLLALGAHFFGLLVIASEILWVFWGMREISTRLKWISIIAVGSLLVVLIAFAPAQTFFYNIVARWTNPYGDPVYMGARGISLAQTAKVLLTFFFFSLGEHVYLFDPVVVVPGLLILFVAGVASVWNIWRSLPNLRLWLIPLIVMPVLLYLIFDPLSPSTLQGASPRYLMFLIPLFYLSLAGGLQLKKSSWLLGAVIAVNLAGLVYYWHSDWAYEDDLVNWRQAVQWARPHVTPSTAFMLDGSSEDLATFYFPPEWRRRQLNADPANEQVTRELVFAYNWHPDARMQSTHDLSKLETQFEPTAVLSQYPLFAYVYDRKPTPNAYPVSENGWVSLPNEIYGIEFQDLHLPFQVRLGQQNFDVIGGFGLPALDGANIVTIPLGRSVRARRIVLLSQLISPSAAQDGAKIADLKVSGPKGLASVFPIRMGYETNAWDRSCARDSCRAVYQWRKRIALVGFQSYPNAWNDFNASIFASEYMLDSPTDIQKLEFERAPASGRFYVWGIVIEP